MRRHTSFSCGLSDGLELEPLLSQLTLDVSKGKLLSVVLCCSPTCRYRNWAAVILNALATCCFILGLHMLAPIKDMRASLSDEAIWKEKPNCGSSF